MWNNLGQRDKLPARVGSRADEQGRWVESGYCHLPISARDRHRGDVILPWHDNVDKPFCRSPPIARNAFQSGCSAGLEANLDRGRRDVKAYANGLKIRLFLGPELQESFSSIS